MLETIMSFTSRQLVFPGNDGAIYVSKVVGYASLPHCPLNKQKVNSYFCNMGQMHKEI